MEINNRDDFNSLPETFNMDSISGQKSQAVQSSVLSDFHQQQQERISQVLYSIHQSSIAVTCNAIDTQTPNTLAHSHCSEKEDIDEDERLLTSEEGKKLSNKERQQLRNKVSARAFRSRRKGKLLLTHYINSYAKIL
jgi:hypothetical protein